MKSVASILGLALVAVAASGCAVPTDASTGEDPAAATGSAYSIVWDIAWLPARGGTGGNATTYERCANDEVAIGVFGRGGSYVDSLGLICSPLRADGTHGFGHPLYSGDWPATEGSGNKFEFSCPYDGVMTALYGGAHTYLDRIGIACTYVPFTGGAFPLRDIGGGGGGDPFGDYCPPGYVIHGIDVKHGSWVDREQAQCVRLAP